MSGVAVLSFLPCFTCLFWLVLTILLHKRIRSQVVFLLLLLFIGLSTMANAGLDYVSSQGYALVFYFIDQFFTSAVIPLSLIYIERIKTTGKRNVLMLNWMIIPVTLLFVELALFGTCGKEDFSACIFNQTRDVYSGTTDLMHKYIRICSVYVYTGILALGTLFIAIRTALSRDKKLYATKSVLITLLASVFTVTAIWTNLFNADYSFFRVIWSVLLTVIIFILSYQNSGLSDYIPNAYSIIRDYISTDVPVIDTPQKNDQEETAQASNTDIQAPVARQELTEEDFLRVKFEKLIINNKYYLKPGITIADVASELGTNRTYISRLVNNVYDMGFKDYINTLRISYAQKYLRENKNVKQSEIATVCGFPNASTFNNSFKKKTGVTPKIWVATNS